MTIVLGENTDIYETSLITQWETLDVLTGTTDHPVVFAGELAPLQAVAPCL